MTTRIYGLDDGLSIRTIVWTDCGSQTDGRGKNGRRESESVKVCAFGYNGVLEDNEKTGIVLPLDFEASIHVLVVSESGLDVLRFEFLGEPREGENAGY